MLHMNKIHYKNTTLFIPSILYFLFSFIYIDIKHNRKTYALRRHATQVYATRLIGHYLGVTPS